MVKAGSKMRMRVPKRATKRPTFSLAVTFSRKKSRLPRITIIGVVAARIAVSRELVSFRPS